MVPRPMASVIEKLCQLKGDHKMGIYKLAAILLGFTTALFANTSWAWYPTNTEYLVKGKAVKVSSGMWFYFQDACGITARITVDGDNAGQPLHEERVIDTDSIRRNTFLSFPIASLDRLRIDRVSVECADTRVIVDRPRAGVMYPFCIKAFQGTEDY